MEYQLPTEFDIVIIGTGIVESIVSAAASRIGKTVLHIDSKDYYGGFWASFNLDQIEKLCESSEHQNNVIDLDIQLPDNYKIISIGNNKFCLNHTCQKWSVPKKKDKINLEDDKNETTDSLEALEIDEVYTQETLLEDSRKFSIDIAPKLQFARGDLVDLLISSNIARYSEYRSVSRILTWLKGQLEVVPCTRSDVFSNANVSIIEKRMLMKFLATCVDSEKDQFKDYENKTFLAYLKDQKLTENIIHYVLYAIAMCTESTLCSEGVDNVKRFLNSLGRFGKTPFLYSMYGSGELSQAFCRLSAVFGGVYALNQPLNGFVFDQENIFKGLIRGKQLINAQYLVMGVEYSPMEFIKSIEPSYISRGIFITNRSIMVSEKEHLTLLLYPLKNGKQLCHVIELGSLTGTCPKGYHIVHMFTKQENNPKEDLEECVLNIFEKEESEELTHTKPQILWSFYYSAADVSYTNLQETLPENVYLCPGPEYDLDMDLSIEKAKNIFKNIYPDLEFLPRAPDPEEIIIEDSVSENDDNDNSSQKNTDTHIEEEKQEVVNESQNKE